MAANSVKTYACKKATNNSINIIKSTNNTESGATPKAAPVPAWDCTINIKEIKLNIVMCPAVMLANNLIINTRGFKKTPNISIGVNISNTGLGTPGIAKICCQ